METPPTTKTAARKYQPTARMTKYQPIHISSTNSSCQKHHLKMREVKCKKTVSSTNRWQREKQFYIKQLLFTAAEKKC